MVRHSYCRPWIRLWRLTQHCMCWGREFVRDCSCIPQNLLNHIWILRIMLNYSPIKSSGLWMIPMCIESPFTRPSREIWLPNQSMVPYSYSILKLGNYSLKSSIHQCGQDKRDWDNWPNGRQLRKWLHSLEHYQWRNNQDRLLSLGRDCWIHWKCIYWISPILLLRDLN